MYRKGFSFRFFHFSGSKFKDTKVNIFGQNGISEQYQREREP